ncbi:MAG: hypothetical protein IPP49_18720 [Saprospiraceae bacterium]|nr:hypothetical protein [Saprospiraceae bacterium]
MPISQSDQLFQLVNSLTKAEKRNFTFYSSRIQEAESLKYMQLFDLIEKQKELNDTQILSKLKDVDKTQYSNLKRHLYKQLMVSLRMIHIQKKNDIQVREYLDYVEILYGKGLYLQALKILDKAKLLAEKTNNDLLYLSILETEKNIESRHITRSGPDIVPDLITKSEDKIRVIDSIVKLSNVRIQLHSHYIKYGHVKDMVELEKFRQKYLWLTTYKGSEQLTYHEKIFLFQSMVWYYYIILDFENCLIHAEYWVKLFQESPVLITEDPDLFMRGYHYILTCAYNLRQKQGYSQLMFLMAHYDAGNYDIMDYLIKGTKQFFNHMEEKTKLQVATIKFFKKW